MSSFFKHGVDVVDDLVDLPVCAQWGRVDRHVADGDFRKGPVYVLERPDGPGRQQPSHSKGDYHACDPGDDDHPEEQLPRFEEPYHRDHRYKEDLFLTKKRNGCAGPPEVSVRKIVPWEDPPEPGKISAFCRVEGEGVLTSGCRLQKIPRDHRGRKAWREVEKK